jgi:galactokinase
VITEQSRVEAAVKALRQNDFTTFGQLMYASHASLRDDFEVSTPELNTFVEMAQTAGALGARLTGAGFGGAAIALVRQGDTDVLIDNTALQFKDRDFAEPSFYVFQPSDGARLESSASSD